VHFFNQNNNSISPLFSDDVLLCHSHSNIKPPSNHSNQVPPYIGFTLIIRHNRGEKTIATCFTPTLNCIKLLQCRCSMWCNNSSQM